MRRIGSITLVVPSYEEGIAFFVGVLGFSLVEDTDLGSGKRWVLVAPEAGPCLLLAQPAGAAQRSAIGRQAGGRVFLFLETDDFARDHRRMLDAGVVFTEAPRDEPYGRVAVFRDPFGNLWDLIEPASGYSAASEPEL